MKQGEWQGSGGVELVSALFICPKELWFDLPAVEIF
jgi:hypothetical protein